MKTLTTTLLFTLIYSSCSTSPTQYTESTDKKKNGFTDATIDENLKKVEFLGNSSTKKDKAEAYAKFRAVEICRKQDKLTHILLVTDKTFDKDISYTTSYYPTYYYGAAPYYGRYGYHGGGVAMYSGSPQMQTTNETYTYPYYEVYFECMNDPIDSKVSFKPLSSSQVKDFVKDLKGAVQVDEILPDSPNRNILKSADIIVKANNERVGNKLELYQASRRNPRGNKFILDIFREGKPMKVEVNFEDVTELVTHAEKGIVKEGCKDPSVQKVSKLCK